MTILHILIIQLIVVFIIDLSGVIQELEKIIAKWMKVTKVHIPKPFACSLCTTFWLSIIYILCTGHFTIPYIGFCALMAYLTPVANNMLIAVKEELLRLTNWLM